jgi:hypothetical protein
MIVIWDSSSPSETNRYGFEGRSRSSFQVERRSMRQLVWIAFVSALATNLGCSDDGGGGDGDGDGDGDFSGDEVAMGTITLPADATGACYLVGLDNDSTGASGLVSHAVGEVSGDTIDFSLTAAPGDYYIWVIVDLDESASTMGSCATADVGPPNSGDYFGYYGTGLGEPSSGNVTLPADGGTFDITLGTFP